MNERQKEFAREMLAEALESIGFPEGIYKAFSFPRLSNPDRIKIVVFDGGRDLAFADCMVCDAGGMICGSILLERDESREILNFSYKNGKLGSMEVIGNA